MPNWTSGDGADTCGCTFGSSCPYHAEQQARHDADWRAQCAREGTDPDASIEGLEEIVLAVELSQQLSAQQKKAIRRIMFPARPI